MVSALSLVVACVAAIVSLVMYLVEETRRRATPSWQPQRTVEKGESSQNYQEVRDRGRIYVVGEGTMEGATLDVLHGTLVAGTGEFPRCLTFRDGSINYRFVANRKSVEEGLEPIVALYWWQPGIFNRRFKGFRLYTLTLRYEQMTRSWIRPWKRVWKKAGKKPLPLPKLTSAPSRRFGVW